MERIDKEYICRTCKKKFISFRKNPCFCRTCLSAINEKKAITKIQNEEMRSKKQKSYGKISILEVCERANKLKISYGTYVSTYLS